VEDRCALFSYIYGMNMCAIPQMVDDRRLNEITITTLVTTTNPWHGTGNAGEKVFFSPESGFDYVLDEPEGRRRFPFELGDVREGRITTLIKTDYKLDWPIRPKTWNFGALCLSFTPHLTAQGYEAVREYTVSKPWLTATEKMALDRAYADISRYDRMTVAVQQNRVITWLPGFLWRVVVWAGVPVIGLLVWLAARYL
jgi:hypothetical protein